MNTQKKAKVIENNTKPIENNSVSIGLVRIEALRSRGLSFITDGDGGNDAAMLRYAGLGVAMKNASDEAKAAADQVLAYTNDEDGVARAIEAVLKHGTL